MGGTGDARVISPDHHLQRLPYFILGFIQNLRHQRFKVLLNIIVVLVGRDYAVSLG
jgi:hypothetical protein